MKGLGNAMIDREADSDAAVRLLEHRWFASMKAASAVQAECEVLREVMDQAERAWGHARAQLAGLEALRDALGEQLAERDARWSVPGPVARAVFSAA